MNTKSQPNSERIKQLQQKDCNLHCFDCCENSTTYFTTTLGTFVCSKCAGILRDLNIPVKGISVSTFTGRDKQVAELVGNDNALKIYMGNFDWKKSKIPFGSQNQFRVFLNEKYIDKCYYSPNKTSKKLDRMLNEDSNSDSEEDDKESGDDNSDNSDDSNNSNESEYSDDSENSEYSDDYSESGSSSEKEGQQWNDIKKNKTKEKLKQKEKEKENSKEGNKDMKTTTFNWTKWKDMNIKKPTKVNYNWNDSNMYKAFETIKNSKVNWGKLWENYKENKPMTLEDFDFIDDDIKETAKNNTFNNEDLLCDYTHVEDSVQGEIVVNHSMNLIDDKSDIQDNVGSDLKSINLNLGSNTNQSNEHPNLSKEQIMYMMMQYMIKNNFQVDANNNFISNHNDNTIITSDIPGTSNENQINVENCNTIEIQGESVKKADDDWLWNNIESSTNGMNLFEFE